MAFSDHIAACNAHELGNFLPLYGAEQRVGWLHRRWLADFSAFPHTLVVEEQRVSLHPALDNAEKRTAAVDAMCLALADRLPQPRQERFAVRSRWGEPCLFEVDRAFASLFGIGAFGVHVNGLVQRPDGLWLWVAKRAADRLVAPGKLDNLIAGGQPSGLGLRENLRKEAAEEADVPPDLADQARPVGTISYCLEDEWGLKPDTMFCFDLLLPPDFVPRNTDGEIESFALLPLSQVARRVDESDDFKFNVNLVILDLLIRHGYLHPDQQADYTALTAGLRRQLPL